jgi:hypothetical protein
LGEAGEVPKPLMALATDWTCRALREMLDPAEGIGKHTAETRAENANSDSLQCGAARDGMEQGQCTPPQTGHVVAGLKAMAAGEADEEIRQRFDEIIRGVTAGQMRA